MNDPKIPFGVAGWQAIAICLALIAYILVIVGGFWFWLAMVLRGIRSLLA